MDFWFPVIIWGMLAGGLCCAACVVWLEGD